MNILIVFIINKNAITNNLGDVRYEVFKNMANYFKNVLNYNVFIKACNKGTTLTGHLRSNYTIFNEHKHKKNLDLIITWMPVLDDYNSYNVPKIVYENGHMKNSIITF